MMTSGIFHKYGQVAPFMIAVIVVLLVAIMVVVNIGKVGLSRTNTSNAADAGALAGGTTHNNTLNNIADVNAAMNEDYITMQATFLVPISICYEPARTVAWLAYTAYHATQYALAWSRGEEGYDMAEEQAFRLAFSNAGVTEAKERSGTESYDDWLRRESDFSRWMRTTDPSGSSQTYPPSGWGSAWNDSGDSVTVDVDAPDFPGLIPLPGLFISTYLDWIVPCIPCTECCLVCAAELAAYVLCLTAAGTAPIEGLMSVGVVCNVGCCYCLNLYEVSHSGMWSYGILKYVFPSMVICGGVAFNVVEYTILINTIADIVEDNPEIDVTVTRVEPERDLGLWTMRYEDPGTGGGISSGARARTDGGTIGPIPDPDYDSYLIGGS